MTLKERIRAGGVLVILLIAMGFVFLGNQRPVHAQIVPPNLGSQIVCFVYSNLNDFGTPLPLLNADGCAAAPDPSGSGELEVIKVVTGTSTPSSDFNIHVKNGGTEISGSPVVASASGVSFIGLAPGNYSVSEASNTTGVDLSDYNATYSNSCSGGSVSITSSNTPVVCTITNTWNGSGNGGGSATDPVTGGLVVKKVIVNTGGGTATPSMFSFQVNGASITAFNASGENDLTLPVGSYHVTEVASNTYTASYSNCLAPVVTASATTTCTITNTFNVSNNGGGGNDSVTGTSDLSVTKSVSTTTPSVGGQVTYTLTATNNGPDAATNAAVTDMLPAGLTFVSTTTPDTIGVYNPATGVWTIGVLGNTASAVLHIMATINATDTLGVAITNTATISSSSTDSTSGNNTGTAAITPIASSTLSDVSITKSVDTATPNIGGTVTYTITASDTGVDATGVVVQDVLPSGVTFVSTSTSDIVGKYASSTGAWTIGKLSSTTPATLHIIATVDGTDAYGTVITNSVTVTSGDTSSDNSNNSASVALTVTNPNPTNGGGGGGGSPAPTTSGRGGGGNGPIAGSFGAVNGGGGGGSNGPVVANVPGGQVLGASTSTSPNACSQYLTAFIGSGKDNDSSQVMRLQTFLNTYEGDNLTVNGIYDAATLAATEKFQKTYGNNILAPWGISSPTGYVYLTTRKEVNTIYCHFTENFPLTDSEQAIVNASRAALASGSPASQSTVSKRRTSSEEQTAAAIAAGMNNLSSTGSSSEGTSSPVSNPFSGIGNFFSKLFHH